MNTENEHSYFHVNVLGASDKAFKVEVINNGGTVHWVPKSLCKLTVSGTSQLEVESWFAEKEGMSSVTV